MASPAAAPPLSNDQRDEAGWRGGDRPPHGADNSEHVRLDSVQVRRLEEGETGQASACRTCEHLIILVLGLLVSNNHQQNILTSEHRCLCSISSSVLT